MVYCVLFGDNIDGYTYLLKSIEIPVLFRAIDGF